MQEKVIESFSHLAPLLVVVLILFGLVMGALILVRIRLRQPGVSHAHSAGQLEVGDVVVVLGRTLQVTAVHGWAEALWASLEIDQEVCRVWIQKDLTEILYFPVRQEAPAGADRLTQISQAEGAGLRPGGEVELGPQWKLTVLAGRGDHVFVLEERAETFSLWRGKSIPVEGLKVL